MIHGIYSNKSSFHSVELATGLNVILAERTTSSTQKDTRNGLGKSTLLSIIDFCLGGRASKGKGLCIEPLREWEFTLELTVAGNRVRVTRSVDSPNRVAIEGPTSGWPEQPEPDTSTGERVLKIDRWKAVLGNVLFGLPRLSELPKYQPTYRSLISYFIRQGLDAYTDPFRHYRQQQAWDIQINAGFLLGLNWAYPAQLQGLRDQEQALRALSLAIRTGAIVGARGSIGELETEAIQLEGQVERERQGLTDFRVHPQYENIQQEADRTTAEIHELANHNITDRRRLTQYRESIAGEQAPTASALERLYEETGLVFPNALRRTLLEAREFHRQIVANRRAFLETEIERLERQIERREMRIKELTDARAASLEILRTHGALQEMTVMQEKHIAAKRRLEEVRARIREMKGLTARKRDIGVAKAELAQIAERDHDQRRPSWTTAVRLFNENSQALYDSPGRLVIDIAESGYRLDVEIERSGSEGIGKMKVFCFDLMLLQLIAPKTHQVNFLVHDSVLYDGVDSRQRALALQRAAAVSAGLGGQYICTLNSDMVPRDDFDREFNFDRHVRLILTDEDPSGSLLGFQFERPVP